MSNSTTRLRVGAEYSSRFVGGTSTYTITEAVYY
ncbi:unnamed protein product [Tenebrio molitor]|nr:unnamed protein product [Tenebrio molitor]